MEGIVFLLIVGLIVAGILYFPYWCGTIALLTTPLRRQRFELVELNELHPSLLEAHDRAAQKLKEMGFEFIACSRTAPVQLNMDGYQYQFFYLNTDRSVLASLVETPYPGALRDFEVILETQLVNGTTLFTSDSFAHALMPMPENYVINDIYCGDTYEQLSFHKGKVEEHLEGNVCKYSDDAAALIDGANRSFTSMWEYCLHKKHIFKLSQSVYCYRPIRAFRAIKQYINGQSRACSKHAPSSESYLTEYGISKQLAFTRGHSKLAVVVLFAISLFAFITSFGAVFNVELACILAAVIFIHELGHYLAMKLLGYSNSRMYFVPFVGGVTLGEKSQTKPWQEVIVYLSGPLPGIMLAAILWYFIPENVVEWQWMFVVMLLAVNIFNLLPFTPLDGGRVLDSLLFAKRPWVAYLISIVSLVVLIVVSLWLEAPLMLAFLLPLAWYLFKRFRPLQQMRSVKLPIKRGHMLKEQQIAFAASTVVALDIKDQDKMPLAQCIYQYVKAPKASKIEIGVGLGVYGVALIFSIMLILSMFGRGNFFDDSDYKYESREYWDSDIESAEGDERWLLIAQAVYAFLVDNQPEEASHYLEEMRLHAQTFSEPNWHLAHLRIAEVNFHNYKMAEGNNNYEFASMPLSESDVDYIRDNLLEDREAKVESAFTIFDDLIRRSPESYLSQKYGWVNYFERSKEKLSPDQVSYLYYTKGNLYEKEELVGQAIAAYMNGFEAEKNQATISAKYGNFGRLVNLLVENEEFEQLASLAARREEQIVRNYKADDEYLNSTYIRQYHFEGLSWVNQIQSWAYFLLDDTDSAILFNKRARQFDEQYRELKEDDLWGNNSVSLAVDSELFLGALTIEESRAAGRDPFDGIPDESREGFSKSCECKKRAGYSALRYSYYSAYMAVY